MPVTPSIYLCIDDHTRLKLAEHSELPPRCDIQRLNGRGLCPQVSPGFRWTLWNIGPVTTGPMFHRAAGGPVGGDTAGAGVARGTGAAVGLVLWDTAEPAVRSEEHTAETQSPRHL